MPLLQTNRLALLAAKLRRLWQPVPIFGVILIALICCGAFYKTRSDREALWADAVSDLANLTQLMSQDAQRTTDELDRIIRFLRRSHERAGYDSDWADLVREEYTINSRTLQIAVIDAKGKMITSTAMLYPKTPIDLSDREHFRFHKTSTSDILHVSRPVIGRATGKWSIQFTRKFVDKTGAFGGVIVASLNPDEALSIYQKLEAFKGAGFALIGNDDIIRAGAGTYAGMIGRGLVEGEQQTLLPSKDPDVTMTWHVIGGQPRLTAVRAVRGTPLSVVVAITNPPHDGLEHWNKYYALALLTSLMVLLATVFSIRQQRAYISGMRHLANDDALTKLPNRHAFQTDLAQRCQDMAADPAFSLHLIDLDRFKAVNDTFGHPVGDDLLRLVARRLQEVVRKSDSVYRLGGDEFALIQERTVMPVQAETVARRICHTMAAPFEVGGHRLEIGASVGIAMAAPELAEPTALLQAADIALYRSKALGRGNYTLYDSELGIALLRRKQLEGELRAAIESEQLELHFQPKVLLDDGQKVCGYEALVRWNHPLRGQLSPAEFIGLAEETGLIVPLGAWAINNVCRHFAALEDHTTVAVNCSAAQFAKDDIASVVRKALNRSGLAPHRLEIEITETILMREERNIVAQLRDIRAMGVRVSLDDFGTGYSSLAYLEKYPIDCIKIDRSFIAKITREPRALAITRAIIALAAELDMTAVAEGIETAEQGAILRGLGCQLGQGYLYGRPLPASLIWPGLSAATQDAASQKHSAA